MTFPALLSATEKAKARDALMTGDEKPLVMQRRDAGPVLVSRCPAELGRRRATWFYTDMEPAGHGAMDTFGEAVRLACDRGGDPRTAKYRSANK